MPVSPALRRQRQEEQGLKVILGYLAKFKTSLSTGNLAKKTK